jgi:hypothetical protein
MKFEPADEKPDWLRHVTRMNKTGCPKSNAEVQTKWSKKICKNFEETIRQSRTSSTKT